MRCSRLSSSLSIALAVAGCTEGAIGTGETSPTMAAAGVGGGTASSGGSAGDASGAVGGTGGAGGTPLQIPIVPGAMLDPACPWGMAHVPAEADAAGYCMDRYEAPNEPGAEPLVMQSALLGQAWCDERGKRLCSEDEWQRACRGPGELQYPYGNVHQVEQCNDAKTWKVVDEGVLATWPSEAAQAEVAELYQATPSGSLAGCMSDYGVFDLTGNVEEWVVRTKPHMNNYDHILVGCYWAGCYGGSKPTCGSVNSAHADAFMFYETGFRCCSDEIAH